MAASEWWQAMIEPHWLRHARESIGQRETLGPNDSPWIRRMWAKLNGSWLLGQPWCGGAMAFWMHACGIKAPAAYYRAKAWLDWGTPVAAPAVGAVVVFDRQGGGHVGLIVGKTDDGRLLVLGANQRDSVSIAAFDQKRAVGYRWPSEWMALLPVGALPVIAHAGANSTNEA
jgi:uncharacterized protein (TIGR02594 family)